MKLGFGLYRHQLDDDHFRFARQCGASHLVIHMDGPYDKPIPNGMIWNMVYDRDAPPGELAPITTEELWRRHGEFLDAIIPIAEEAGVTLAAHPDDPPTPTVRNQPRLVNQPGL